MATQVQCYTPIKARVLRLTVLDECGVPYCGDDPRAAQILATGFTQVQQQAQYDTGTEHIVRTADAELCVNDKDPDALKRMDLTIDFCVVNPAIIANTAAPSRMLTTGQVATGFALSEGMARQRWSLEVWQRVSGRGACDPTGAQLWVYNAWPNLGNGKIGDYTAAVGPSQIQVTAESARASELWWLGDDWLGDDAVSPVPDHWLQNVTTTPPPEAPQDCAVLPVACPGS